MAEFDPVFPLFGFDDSSLDVDGTLNTPFYDVNPSNVMQMLKTEEKSPYHESDSGVSDASGEASEGPSSGSPWENDCDIPFRCDIPPVYPDMFDPFMLEIPAEPFLNNISEIESDDVQHFQSGVRNETDKMHVLETTVDSQAYYRKTRSQTGSMGRAQESHVGGIVRAKVQVSKSGNTNSKITAAERQYPVSVSEDEYEIDIADDNDDVVSRCKPKGSVRVNKIGESLPSTKHLDKSNVTSIKVLRIVQSGNGSNAEDDITKALEERNRKNAEMARQNRLKKKEHLGNLEHDVEVGRKRIYELEFALNNAEEERDEYKREVEYLKSVLANQSALAGLLKNIPSIDGVTLSSSVSRKRVTELDHSYTSRKKNCLAGHQTPSHSAEPCAQGLATCTVETGDENLSS